MFRWVLFAVASANYLIVTSNDSGSTWVCNLLSQTTTCGGEVLIELSHKPNVTWAEWSQAADRWFDAQRGVAGFKLMYYQMPRSLSKFYEYVVDRNLDILHLVREATVLRLAPDLHRYGRVRSAELAVELQLKTRQWTPKLKGLKAKVKWLEGLDKIWTNRLARLAVNYLYVSYENLLLQPTCGTYRRDIVRFVNPAGDLSKKNSTLYRTHDITCEARIAGYATKVAALLSGTRAHQACAMLRNASACD